MKSIFKKSIELNMKIEKFLDTISNSLLLFEKATQAYLQEDYTSFIEFMDRICTLESEADALETEIKVTLYKFMLLPDVRADVLSLIKSLDNIVDAVEEITKDFAIQKPAIPQKLHPSLTELIDNTTRSADFLLIAARVFFSEVHLVTAHINKIKFYEHETDILEDKINDLIFNGQVFDNLAEKLQLKDFITKIAGISDEAENIGAKLTIFTIKREI